MKTILFHSAILLLVPVFTTWAATKSKIIKTISPVVLCYAIGILLANLPGIPLHKDVSLYGSYASVLLALPLLLLSVDIAGWMRLAKSTLLSTALAAAAVTIVSVPAFFLFQNHIEDNWKIAGMLVGTFTGGSPNMAAIGSALQVEPEQFVLVNAADVLLCSLYFLFLISWGPKVFGKILAPFPIDRRREKTESTRLLKLRPSLGQRVLGVFIGLLVAGVGSASYFAAPDGYREIATILSVTSLAIFLSFVRQVRSLPGTYESGQWILLIFCVGIGTMANFETLLTRSPWILAYTAFMLFGTILLHLLLCSGLKVDRDTWIITSSAAIFSPAFIGVIADRLQNREVVVSGVTGGLIGFAVGNYLGVSVALLLQRFFVNG
jgi:uncharacterized membrane protein